MHSIAIRQIDDALKNGLRLEAARQGCSMEEQARRILRAALTAPKETPPAANRCEHLAIRIHKRFNAAGGVDLPEVPRTVARPPVKF